MFYQSREISPNLVTLTLTLVNCFDQFAISACVMLMCSRKYCLQPLGTKKYFEAFYGHNILLRQTKVIQNFHLPVSKLWSSVNFASNCVWENGHLNGAKEPALPSQ